MHIRTNFLVKLDNNITVTTATILVMQPEVTVTTVTITIMQQEVTVTTAITRTVIIMVIPIKCTIPDNHLPTRLELTSISGRKSSLTLSRPPHPRIPELAE